VCLANNISRFTHHQSLYNLNLVCHVMDREHVTPDKYTWVNVDLITPVWRLKVRQDIVCYLCWLLTGLGRAKIKRSTILHSIDKIGI